ncbi:unnamed protein product [Candidula unifasciata]|uniref:G-protein coupled receptors family 1 profile domain-containing protein n=1 Tax=Candidula unifasciata TaxID=100452 RepID=A0A8S3YJ84_9EUPU|nr:unnamed protein product [Candidula unifasciata]
MSIVSEVNTTFEDPTYSEQNSEDSHLALFILWGTILPLIASIGLVGNILTIIVLWRREMHSTTILYLRGLVITDTGILLGSVITLTPISCANYVHSDASEYFKDHIYPVIHTPGYYIIMTLQQCNVWITVSVSMERYIAICHPFRAARLITRKKTIIVLITIVIISLIYNIPHLLATTASPCAASANTTAPAEMKVTVINSEGDLYELLLSSTPPTPLSAITTASTPAPVSYCLEVVTTDFGNTEFYMTYRTIMYSIIIYVIPFLALLIINSFLIKELMAMQQRRSGTNINDENEANLSMVLVLIVIVFIFCQTPGLISQFDLINTGAFIYWLAISNLLFTTNSAVNFLIYTAFGRKFRRVLMRVFRHIFQKNRRQSQSSCRTSQYTNGDIDNSDETTTQCTSLGFFKCFKKKSKENGNTGENIPLNTVVSDTTSAQNGILRKIKQNNGTKQIRYANARENIGKEPLTDCTTADSVSLAGRNSKNSPIHNSLNNRKLLTINSVVKKSEDTKTNVTLGTSDEQTAATHERYQ